MVNITESFTKLYGRPPSEQELAAMWQMKREQEGFKKQLIKERTCGIKRSKEPVTPKALPKNTDARKWPYRAPKMAKMINRMLIIQTKINDIAYVLGVTENVVMSEIKRWQLPQHNDK
jgi:hypothetical protein